ncbi:hypothetical protein [Streptomyces yerevanensis]|nr:hypothetical protein [Streptomyces yerevanensis]
MTTRAISRTPDPPQGGVHRHHVGVRRPVRVFGRLLRHLKGES